MALSTQPYKGARDFYPDDKRRQNYLFSTLRQTVERFGYEEYDAPILEPLDLYLAKSGEEIVNEQTYAFTDRGDRRVALRPEMTPSVSRMVAARRQELAYPLRWYSIPNLWRYERPQRGRMREHWQLNVDMFGVADTSAEYEMISLVDAIMKAFNATRDMYEIRINSRVFTDRLLMQYLRFDPVQAHGMAKLIDRQAKMEPAAFVAQAEALASPSQRDAGVIDKLLTVLRARKINELPAELQAEPSIQKMQAMLQRFSIDGITNVRFDPGLMRGFDYYTDIVFEIYDTHPDNNRAMFGGGRYDGLVGLFGVEPVPTIGFGMGDVTLANFLELHDLIPKLPNTTDVYAVLVGDETFEKSQRVIQELRSAGINVAVDFGGRKVGQQIKAAEKKGIDYVMVIGEEELAEHSFSLKNLRSGVEEKHSISRIVSLLKDHRR